MTQQKCAIITGGGSGIGFATAERFVRGGYRVVITGRNREKLDRAVAELGEACGVIRQDMDQLGEIPGFVTRVRDACGRIDVLVNNAGINQKKPLLEVTDEDFQSIVKTNQTALFALSREVAKVMSGQEGGGSIIHISSMSAHFGIPKIISYSASKTAVEGMTRAMAVELAPLGIRVNCVAPGFIKTPMSSRALDSDPDRKNRVLARTPANRLGEPAEVANAVFFLGSDEASFITGEVVRVDGGNAIGF